MRQMIISAVIAVLFVLSVFLIGCSTATDAQPEENASDDSKAGMDAVPGAVPLEQFEHGLDDALAELDAVE